MQTYKFEDCSIDVCPEKKRPQKIFYSQTGKPRMKNYFVSMSTKMNKRWTAKSKTHKVGIDVETRVDLEKIEKYAPRFCTKNELKLANPQLLWQIKECCVKIEDVYFVPFRIEVFSIDNHYVTCKVHEKLRTYKIHQLTNGHTHIVCLTIKPNN